MLPYRKTSGTNGRSFATGPREQLPIFRRWRKDPNGSLVGRAVVASYPQRYRRFGGGSAPCAESALGTAIFCIRRAAAYI
jgi:hypothetical protein